MTLEPQYFLPFVLPIVYIPARAAICLISCHHLLLLLQKTLFCLILKQVWKQILQLFNPSQPHQDRSNACRSDSSIFNGKILSVIPRIWVALLSFPSWLLQSAAATAATLALPPGVTPYQQLLTSQGKNSRILPEPDGKGTLHPSSFHLMFSQVSYYRLSVVLMELSSSSSSPNSSSCSSKCSLVVCRRLSYNRYSI